MRVVTITLDTNVKWSKPRELCGFTCLSPYCYNNSFFLKASLQDSLLWYSVIAVLVSDGHQLCLHTCKTSLPLLLWWLHTLVNLHLVNISNVSEQKHFGGVHGCYLVF